MRWYYYLHQLALSLENIILTFFKFNSIKANVAKAKHAKWLIPAVVFDFYGSFIKDENLYVQNGFKKFV